MRITRSIGAVVLCSALLVSCEGGGCGEEPAAFTLNRVATSEHQWTGVAVSGAGRIFVNFPRWSSEVPVSVAELGEDGRMIPYPDDRWNGWDPSLPPDDRFVCVQSVYVDDLDMLWVLDPASPFLSGTVEGGPKLVQIDLGTDEVARVIPFDSTVAPHASYLNDVRVDTGSGKAFITDSGLGAIIVVDLASGTASRVLGGHPSVRAEKESLEIAGGEIPIVVHSDGIALDVQSGMLYYQALTGRTLYRVPVSALVEAAAGSGDASEHVEEVGRSGASDGLLFRGGAVYLTSIEKNAVRRIWEDGTTETVATDSLLEWPDSFAPGAEGSIFVTTSRIAFPPGRPYMLFRLDPVWKSAGSGKGPEGRQDE